MENTTQSAKDFLTKYRDERTHPVSIDYFAEMMVAYAASVSPKLVMPERATNTGGMHEFYRAAWNECLDTIKNINPSLFK